MKQNLLKEHWENVYRTKDTTNEVSWYQSNPKTSLDLILATDVDKDSNIIDIGGGDSNLVDKLIELGFANVFVLDISGKSLEKAKTRLGGKAKLVTWIENDILTFDSGLRFGIWHDRAAFHFLTKKRDIAHYVEIAGKHIKPGGYLIISTFSVNGPKKCSGLDITQYSENSIKKTFAERFEHIKSFEEVHITPFNTKQNFIWSVFKKSK